jgi:hypothetical protein
VVLLASRNRTISSNRSIQGSVMRLQENCQWFKWIQQLNQWLRRLMRCKWLIEIVKFLVPFLVGFFYPDLALLIEVLILVWDLWNCFRQG